LKRLVRRLVGYWIAAGYFESWLQGYEYMRQQGKENEIVWSVKKKAQMKTDDLVALYITAPIKGIIGFGKVKKTYMRGKGPAIWSDEPPIKSKFTIDMRILWMAPSIYGSYIKLEEVPWIKGHIRRGLNHITNKKDRNEFKSVFDTTIEYHEMLRRTLLY
jgi:hypothetical protein